MFGTAEFLADPVGFMQSNIVLPFGTGLGMTQADGRIQEMVLKRYDNKVGSKLGQALDVYCLRQKLGADPIGSSFFAYWLPYQKNQTLSCNLGNGARFMFTDTMDGCTFGVGSSATPGVCRVAHANQAGLGSQMEDAGMSMDQARQGQRIAQEIDLGKTLDPTTMQIIAPSSYMKDIGDGAEVLKATTWGIHELGGAWRFYTQSYYISPAGKYFLRDMKQQI